MPSMLTHSDLIKEEYIIAIETDKRGTNEVPEPNQGYILASLLVMSSKFQKSLYYHNTLFYIPTHKLSDLVDNKFIDEDGVREKKEKFHKRILIVLAIVSIMVAGGSLLTTIINSQKSTKAGSVHIVSKKMR